MSLVRTLAKVAVGVVAANAVRGMVSGGRGSQGPGLGQAPSGTGLEDLLGQVLGQSGGGPRAPQSGGLQDMLGQVLGGGTRAAGGPAGGSLGAELDKLSQLSRPEGSSAAKGVSFGDKLNQSLERFDEPEEPPTREEEDLAAVLLRAMIQAAKADGRIDAQERSRLQDKLGDLGRDDVAFVNAELAREVDADGLARSVPKGAEQQVYMLSAMAMDLDENSEARYLHELAKGLGLNPATINALHERLGIPRLYR